MAKIEVPNGFLIFHGKNYNPEEIVLTKFYEVVTKKSQRECCMDVDYKGASPLGRDTSDILNSIFEMNKSSKFVPFGSGDLTHSWSSTSRNEAIRLLEQAKRHGYAVLYKDSKGELAEVHSKDSSGGSPDINDLLEVTKDDKNGILTYGLECSR
jgi:hypothetical protein